MVVTFLPYKSFRKSARTLSDKHLGKQRVEAFQILNVITGKSKSRGWSSHPATLSWVGYPEALAAYLAAMIREWIARGKKNTMAIPDVPDQYEVPWWLGWSKFHHSHRMMLLRKNPFYYSKHFEVGRNILPSMENYGYIWPGNLTPKDKKRPLKKITAPIPPLLVDPVYCRAVTRKGDVCGTLVKDRNFDLCGVHKPRTKRKPVKAASSDSESSSESD